MLDWSFATFETGGANSSSDHAPELFKIETALSQTQQEGKQSQRRPFQLHTILLLILRDQVEEENKERVYKQYKVEIIIDKSSVSVGSEDLAQ